MAGGFDQSELGILKPSFFAPDRHTRSENGAVFQSGSFDWIQQGQIALLSKPGRPPTVDYNLVEQGLHRSSIAKVIRDLRLLGILYPAVDGDFAALVSSDPGFAEDFQRELGRVRQAVQLPLAAISEEEFARTPWMG